MVDFCTQKNDNREVEVQKNVTTISTLCKSSIKKVPDGDYSYNEAYQISSPILITLEASTSANLWLTRLIQAKSWDGQTEGAASSEIGSRLQKDFRHTIS